jgi:hypothetical protein
MVAESRIANVAGKGGGPFGSRRGSEAPVKPGNAGGGKDPSRTLPSPLNPTEDAGCQVFLTSCRCANNA